MNLGKADTEKIYNSNSTADKIVLYSHFCSEAQLELLTGCVLGGDDANRAFNQSITIQIQGNLDRSILYEALKELVARNDAMRTVFDLSANTFNIIESMPLELKVINSGKDIQETESLFQSCLKDESLHVFDLSNGPLFKFSLITDNSDSHKILLTCHHLVCDGWTLALIIRELSTLYSSKLKVNNTYLPEVLNFKEYIEQEFDFYNSSAYTSQLAFWLNQFKNYTPVSALPYDHPRPNQAKFRSKHISYPLDKMLFAKVRETAKKNNTSVLIAMVSAFEILLYRMSGKTEFVIGIPAAAQPATGFDNLMGHCVNTLPVKASVNGQLSFTDYISQRKLEYQSAFENRRVTFGSLLKTLKVNRDAISGPFVPITFNIDRPIGDALDFYELSSKLIINKRDYSSLEMIMNLSRVDDELIIECSYHEALFEDDTVLNMLKQYEFLTSKLCTNEDEMIDNLPLFDIEKLIDQLSTFNQTFSALSADDNIISLFEKAVIANPNSTALQFEETKYSYTELNEKVNQVANYLQHIGLGKGKLAAIILDRGPEMILVLLGILKVGASYLPIDPSFPKDRIEYMLNDALVSHIILSKDINLKIAESAKAIQMEEMLIASKDFDKDNRKAEINHSDTAYIIYTSGSTGKPKGVVIEHRSLINLLLSFKKKPGFSEADTLLAVTTISFDIAGLELYLPLISGGTLIIASAEVVKDGAELIEKIHAEDITCFQATPSSFKLMLANGWKGKPNLRILCGGESLSKELAYELIPKCKELWNVYGPTETTIWSASNQIKMEDSMISIGRPIDNTEIYILDAEQSLVPVGITGEICIAGEGLARCYHNREELTSEKFIQHPIDKNKRIYRSGDLGKFTREGEIICLGRTDTQIKVRGYRIETGEIEFVLNTCNGIKEAVVVATEWSANDLRLLAFIVPDNEETISFTSLAENKAIELSEVDKQIESDWRETLANVLPEYMIPSGFVYLKKLPHTQNGKTDRTQLQFADAGEKFRVLKKNTKTNKTVIQVKPDWTNLELMVKSIWEETLGIKNAEATDNFFASGGHSLIAIEMMQKIDNKFNLKLPLSSLFVYPSIAELASFISSKDKLKWKYLVPIRAEGNKPPLYIVHGAGLEVMSFNDLAMQLDSSQPVYGIQAMGLMENETPAENLEEIAGNYLKEVLAQNPSGPYHIAGFSAGILIAFEMARQLESAGKVVATLANFDFSLENVNRPIPFKEKLLKKVIEFIPRRIHVLRNMFLHPILEIEYQKVFFKWGIIGFLNRFGANIGDGDPPSMDEMFKIMDQYRDILNAYQLKPYNGDMDLFNTKIKLYFLNDRRTLGWKPYCLKGIHVHPVNGQHQDMILAPNVNYFALSLQKVLDEKNILHNTQYEPNTTKDTKH